MDDRAVAARLYAGRWPARERDQARRDYDTGLAVPPA